MSAQGCLRLEFARRKDVTELVSRYQQAPLQVQKAIHPRGDFPGMAWVYMLSIAGGIVQGDRLTTEIIAGDGAQVHLTTPAATPVYRSPAAPASHELTLRAGADSYVDYLPGPLIPFQGARFHEEVRLVRDPTATLVFGSVLVAGRIAMGESHAYDQYTSRVTALGAHGQLEWREVTHLAPAVASPRRPGLLREQQVLGALSVTTMRARPDALSRALHDVLQKQAAVAGGVSELPGGRGVSVRLLGLRAEPVVTALHAMVSWVREALLAKDQVAVSS